MESFERAACFIKTVTNNVSERGVNLAQDFVNILTKDDSVRLFIYQGLGETEECSLFSSSMWLI